MTKTFFDRVLDVLAATAGAMIVFAMLLVATSVAFRYLLNIDIPWAIVVTEVILLYATFLTAAWVLRDEGHVKADILYGRLGPRGRSAADLLSSIIGVAISVALIVFGGQATLQNLRSHITTGGVVPVPFYILQIIIPIGGVPLLLQFLRRFRKSLSRLR